MATFVFNPSSGESYSSQWKNHLQQSEYFSDVTSAIQSQTNAYKTELRDASDAVVGTLETGFDTLSESLNQLATMLDWRLSQMIDQQRIANVLLENIAVLMQIPDIQKERQYYIEQGFKHYKNATLDEELYSDALDNLLEAEKREKADYIVLHRIGMIYLYAPKLLDLTKAEEYFRKAGRYAAVESDPRGNRIFNLLSGELSSVKGGHQRCSGSSKLHCPTHAIGSNQNILIYVPS